MKISSLILALLIMGCTRQNVLSLPKMTNDYSIVLSDSVSDARYWHTQTMSTDDMIHLEKRMMEICQDYFPSSEYVLSSGNLLSKEDLIELQRRYSENAPYGLNPEVGLYSIDDLQLDSPYLICDLMEMNFLSLKDSSHMATAISIVMNDYELLNEDQLVSEGFKAKEKLENYLKIEKQIENPLILIYLKSGESSTLPGHFLSVQNQRLNEKWVYLPSSTAEKMDQVLCEEIRNLKEKASELVGHVDFVGKVYFKEERASVLDIEVSVQMKTYTEMKALAFTLASSIEEISNTDLTVNCQIKVLNTTLFVLVRRQNQDEVTLISL